MGRSLVHVALTPGPIRLAQLELLQLWARKAKHEGPDDPDMDAFLAELEG